MLFNGETGVVQSMDDTSVTLLFEKKDACDSCGLKVVCAPGEEAERSLRLPSTAAFSIGQEVRIVEIANLELHLALIQFGLPMLSFLLGLMLGYLLPLQGFIPRELTAFLVACLGLGISFFVARKLISRIVDLIPQKYLRIEVSA